MDPALLTILWLPWIAVGLYAVFLVRTPPRIPSEEGDPSSLPRVSIIVPARNEEENIRGLLESLTDLRYPSFEILVVDDESEDRTGELVQGSSPGTADSLRLISGAPVPPGWLGKPWACFQGAEQATGELLLFTDADTRHDRGLLARAVRCLISDDGDALTILGRQLMGTFWERLLQPQFFMLLALRYPRTGRPVRRTRWRNAIANGQYLLFRREAYEAIGGHRVVGGEVVEDMRLAQVLVRSGQRLLVREDRGLRTRMYRSLAGLVEGWSKNLATGARQAFPDFLGPVLLPASLAAGTVLWLLPPLILAWSLAGGIGGGPLQFAAGACGWSAILWGLATGMMGANPLYGLFYPLGWVVTAYIVLRSWIRGARVQWKGREYQLSKEGRRGGHPGERAGKEEGPGG